MRERKRKDKTVRRLRDLFPSFITILLLYELQRLKCIYLSRWQSQQRLKEANESWGWWGWGVRYEERREGRSFIVLAVSRWDSQYLCAECMNICVYKNMHVKSCDSILPCVNVSHRFQSRNPFF